LIFDQTHHPTTHHPTTHTPHSIGSLYLGVNYCPQRPSSLWYSVKPLPGAPGAPWWLAKAAVSPRGAATLASPKLDLLGGWLRLQFVADADVKRKLYGLRWR
jgi:hypothetical protein